MTRVNTHQSPLCVENPANPVSAMEDISGGLVSKLTNSIRMFKLFMSSSQSSTSEEPNIQAKLYENQTIRNEEEVDNVPPRGKVMERSTSFDSINEQYYTAMEDVLSPMQSLDAISVDKTKTKVLSKDINSITSQPSALKLHSLKNFSKSDVPREETTVQPNKLCVPLKDITINRINAKERTKAVPKHETLSICPAKEKSNLKTQLKDTSPKENMSTQKPTLKVTSKLQTMSIAKCAAVNSKQLHVEKVTTSSEILSKETNAEIKKTNADANVLKQPGITVTVPTNSVSSKSAVAKSSLFGKASDNSEIPTSTSVLKGIPGGLLTLKLMPEHQSSANCEIPAGLTTPLECSVEQSIPRDTTANSSNDLMFKVKLALSTVVDELSQQLSATDISETVPCEKTNTQSLVITNQNDVESKEYLAVPLDPQIHEVLSSPPTDIQENIVTGPYKSPVHYLNVQVKLLREDCMAPLRDGIQQLKRDFSEYGQLYTNEHITLYSNCRFVCKNVAKKIRGYEFCFDVDFLIRNNRLRLSKSLFTGSLLAFSCDNFKTFFFGVVARSDQMAMIHCRVIIVELYNGKELQFSDFNVPYTMVEPSSFFAPYYYVIRTLQSFSNENFPFEQYIINARKYVNRPVYLFKDRRILDEYDLSSNVEAQLGLNSVQFEAYKTALTKELAIIQGPPGTGKTYVGLRIVEGFLKNKRLMNYMNGPILIVCYTNHALDQFVQGVLRYTQNVCRLGCSKKNSHVKPYNYLEMIETFTAMKRAANSYGNNIGIVPWVGAQMRDFHNIFKPDKKGCYTLNVISFKTGLIERRKYTIHLLKAYFFMYIQSPFNEMGSSERTSLRNECSKIERRSCRIRKKISLIHAYNGIADIKYLVDFMDDISLYALKAPRALDRWLTNEISQIDGRKFQSKILAVDISDSEHSDCEYDIWSDSDASIDRVKNVFYTIDLTDIRNDLENTESELRDLKKNNDWAQEVPYLRVQNPYEREKTLQNKLMRLRQLRDLVECNLKMIKEGNLDFKKIETTLVENISSKKYLYSLCIEDRWKLYWYWLECYRRKLHNQMESQSTEYREVVEEFMEVVRTPEMIEVLKTKDVVAMTTTKAAKMHSVLTELKPKIVIIEEAAEVLEAHIMASVSKHCEHLVLIGDHKQLRPSTNVHTLASEYKLDVSLFERLVNNGLHHVTLEVQHRMRPEICDLLTPSIYTNLLNHPSVEKLQSVKGMDGNIQFFDHKVYEGRNKTEHSLWNAFEVNIILRLAHFLLKQGHRSTEITIITAYGGQKELFETTIDERYKFLSGIHVTTIDGFQGEENSIILLSLVRSNMQNNIGFLKTPNRVCVALSRAKQGLYIVGNMRCLSHGSELWQSMKNELIKKQAITHGFKLNCQIHRKSTFIRDVEQFDNVCCLRWYAK